MSPFYRSLEKISIIKKVPYVKNKLGLKTKKIEYDNMDINKVLI